MAGTEETLNQTLAILRGIAALSVPVPPDDSSPEKQAEFAEQSGRWAEQVKSELDKLPDSVALAPEPEDSDEDDFDQEELDDDARLESMESQLSTMGYSASVAPEEPEMLILGGDDAGPPRWQDAP